MANETWKFVQAKSKQAMKQVLGIRDKKTRMKVTLPLALAPVTQEDDMRWNPKRPRAAKRPCRSTTTQNQPHDLKRHPPQQHRAGDAKVAALPTPRKRRRGATQAAGLLVDAAIRQG